METQIKNMMVGRVLSEDNKFMILEVCKDDEYELELHSGDRFLTLLFIRPSEENGVVEVWLPWE